MLLEYYFLDNSICGVHFAEQPQQDTKMDEHTSETSPSNLVLDDTADFQHNSRKNIFFIVLVFLIGISNILQNQLTFNRSNIKKNTEHIRSTYILYSNINGRCVDKERFFQESKTAI